MKLTDLTNTLGFTSVQSTPEKTAADNVKPDISESPAKRKVLYAWETMARPAMKTLDERKVKNLIVIGVVLSLLLVAMQEFFLILGILSLIFVSYMLTQTPQEKIRYQITNQGIVYGDMFYGWANIKHFFLTSEGGVEALAVDLLDSLPARLYITLPNEDKNKILEILAEHVFLLEEEPKTFVTRAYESVMEKLDLEAKS